jgi:uracil permease
MIGGATLAVMSFSGIFGYVQRLFTPRVVAVVLILIAFTLLPTIIDLASTSLSALIQEHLNLQKEPYPKIGR